jgi:hypothetical protein
MIAAQIASAISPLSKRMKSSLTQVTRLKIILRSLLIKPSARASAHGQTAAKFIEKPVQPAAEKFQGAEVQEQKQGSEERGRGSCLSVGDPRG